MYVFLIIPYVGGISIPFVYFHPSFFFFLSFHLVDVFFLLLSFLVGEAWWRQ